MDSAILLNTMLTKETQEKFIERPAQGWCLHQRNFMRAGQCGTDPPRGRFPLPAMRSDFGPILDRFSSRLSMNIRFGDGPSPRNHSVFTIPGTARPRTGSKSRCAIRESWGLSMHQSRSISRTGVPPVQSDGSRPLPKNHARGDSHSMVSPFQGAGTGGTPVLLGRRLPGSRRAPYCYRYRVLPHVPPGARREVGPNPAKSGQIRPSPCLGTQKSPILYRFYTDFGPIFVAFFHESIPFYQPPISSHQLRWCNPDNSNWGASWSILVPSSALGFSRF